MPKFIFYFLLLIGGLSDAQIKVSEGLDFYSFYSEKPMKEGSYLMEGYEYHVFFNLEKSSEKYLNELRSSIRGYDTILPFRVLNYELKSKLGYVKAKGDCVPGLAAQNTFKYQVDTEWIEDAYGDLLPIPIQIDFPNTGLNGDYSIIKTGEWKYFDKNKVIGRCIYKNGKPINGVEVHFHRGSSRLEKTYENGLLIKEVHFMDWGIAMIRLQPKSQNGIGRTSFYNEKNELVKQLGFVNGVLEGEYFELIKNKKDTLLKGKYENGFKVGTWKKWNLSPHSRSLYLEQETQYGDRCPNKVQLYDTLGNLISIVKNNSFVKNDIAPDLSDEIGNYALQADSAFFGKVSDSTFYSDGKIKQVNNYNPLYEDTYELGSAIYYKNSEAIGAVFWYSKYNIRPERDQKSNSLPISQFNYDSLGALFSKVVYQKGRPYSGVELQFKETGALDKYSSYKAGKKHGLHFELAWNGDTIALSNYYNGYQNGYVIDNYFHGNKVFGAKHGKVWYGKFGEINSSAINLLSENYGIEVNFHKNGKVKSKGFKLGWGEDGEWEYFDTLGVFTHRELYLKNELLNIQTRKVPVYRNNYRGNDYKKFEGLFVASKNASGVFGWTVPKGEVIIKSNNENDSLSKTQFNEQGWDIKKPEFSFKTLHRKLFLLKCDYYEPLKFGEEIIYLVEGIKRLNHHRFYADSTFYHWTTNDKNEIVEGYKIKLTDDLRFFSKNDFGEITYWSGRGDRDTNRNYITKRGLYTDFYTNGHIKRNYYKSFLSEYQIGKSESFYSNGQKKNEGTFLDDSGSDGKGVGLHKYYDEKGRLRKTIDFNFENYTISCFNSFEEIIYSQEFLPAQQGRYFFTLNRKRVTKELGETHVPNGWLRYYLNGQVSDSIYYDYRSSKSKIHQEENKKWKSLKGPETCDATAFYVDSLGTYWLGTGSSGGVFKSNNDGASWKALNKGIGPVHVEFLGKVNNAYYIIKSTPDKRKELYKLEGDVWKKGADDELPLIEDSLKAFTYQRGDTNYINYRDWTEKKWSIYDSYWYNTGKNNYYFDSERLQARISMVEGESPLLFKQPSGNQWILNDSSSIFFGKNGVFKYDGESITENRYKGVVASDVKELFQDSKGVIWAVVGLGDVWKLKGKRWTQMFDAHEEWLKDTSQLFLYNANNLEEVNGELRFASFGKVFTIKNDSAQVYIQQPDSMILFSYTGVSNDEFAISLANKHMTDAPKMKHYIKYDKNGKDTIIPYKQHFGRCVFRKSPTNELWAFSPCEIINLTKGKRFSLIRDFNSATISENHIAFKENGDFAFMQSDEEILKYENGEFKTLFTQQLKGVTSIAYYKGELYGGTGFDFAPSCGIAVFGIAHGLYKLENSVTWSRVNDCPNPWVMSLLPTKKGLLVGTSGSGLWLVK